MSDYAPNYTARYRMRYRVLGANHTSTVRLGRIAPAAAVAAGAALYSDLLEALAPMLWVDFTVIGADVAAFDSDVFLPAATVPATPDVSEATGDTSFRPLFCSFAGRSPAGTKASIYLYGWNLSPHSADNTANDFRVLSAENAAVLAAVAVLNGSTGEPAGAIDALEASWYPYANVGINGYYQRKARRG